MNSVLYAAYGSNLHPVRVSERLSSSKLVGTSYIADRGFRFNKRSKDRSGKGNIVRAIEGVHVAIYELDSREKSRLDKIEGLGHGYDEEILDVPNYGKCSTYVADASAVDDILLPYSWYKLFVLLGCRYHEFPNEYIMRINNYGETTDSDYKRHVSNMTLAECIENGT